MTVLTTLAASPLGRTVAEHPTEIWNDSCAIDDLEYAVAFGATGATANPTIVFDVWKRDPARWTGRVRALADEHVDWNEVELAWAIVEEMSIAGAAVLRPAFVESGGRSGRLSVQTDPTLFRSADRMVAQGVGFAALAENIIVKFPATGAGIAAMEEATYRGVSINATVSFTVAQAIAAAEAVERGLERREAEGRPVDDMGPVITIMIGRLEDWLGVLAERDGIVADPDAIPWAGVAVFKRALAEFRARGLRARLLAAAIRHHRHWSELIGGDVIVSLPPGWQRRFNASSVEVRSRIDDPVDPGTIAGLAAQFPDFGRAYEPDGLAIAEFDRFGPSVRTLRSFTASYHDLLHAVRDAILPDPDVASR
jgi:transaldolase